MRKWWTLTMIGLLAVAWLAPAGLMADAATAKRWLVYGNGLYKQRQYDKAIQAYSAALKADRRNAAAWKGLGNAYYAKRDKQNALKYYKYALQLNPNDRQLAAFVSKVSSGRAGGGDPLARATHFYKARQYDQAIQAFNQVIARDPNNAKAYQGLGNAYYAKGDKPNAVKAYRRSVQLNPSNTALSNFLARYAPEGEAEVAAADGPKDWTQPLWRSALLPGWGQVYNGQKTKGIILGAVTLGLLAGTATTFVIGDGARKEYLEAGPLEAGETQAKFDDPYNTWETMAALNHTMYIGFGVAYAFNLIDAIWEAKPKRSVTALGPPPEIEPDNGPSVKMAMADDGVRVKVDLFKF